MKLPIGVIALLSSSPTLCRGFTSPGFSHGNFGFANTFTSANSNNAQQNLYINDIDEDGSPNQKLFGSSLSSSTTRLSMAFQMEEGKTSNMFDGPLALTKERDACGVGFIANTKSGGAFIMFYWSV